MGMWVSNWVLGAGCGRYGAESRVLGVGTMVLNLGVVVGVKSWVWVGWSME